MPKNYIVCGNCPYYGNDLNPGDISPGADTILHGFGYCRYNPPNKNAVVVSKNFSYTYGNNSVWVDGGNQSVRELTSCTERENSVSSEEEFTLVSSTRKACHHHPLIDEMLRAWLEGMKGGENYMVNREGRIVRRPAKPHKAKNRIVIRRSKKY